MAWKFAAPLGRGGRTSGAGTIFAPQATGRRGRQKVASVPSMRGGLRTTDTEGRRRRRR